MMTERERTADENEADMVESAGETTAAAASEGDGGGQKNSRPVGADTRVRVEGEADSDKN